MNKRLLISMFSVVIIITVFSVLMIGACAAEPEPVVEEPVVEEPDVEEPVVEEPDVEEPVVEEPDTDRIGEGLVFGKVPILLANPYHQADVQHFVDYAKSEYGVADVVVIDGEIDSATSVEALDQLLAMNVDAISFHSIDPDAALPGIREARDAGIPIITFYNFTEVQEVPHVTINEAPTSFEMGVIAATKWNEFYPDIPIQVGMIEYVGVAQPIAERSEPFIEGVLSVDPDAEVVSRLDGGGTIETANAAMADMLVANPEVNIIYGTSADYSLGAFAALEAAGRGGAEDGVPLTEIVVGTDASESELLKLFDPSTSFKITQGLTPKENGRLKVDTLIQMLAGEIALDAQEEFAGTNKLFDYWDMDVNEAEAWMEEQYFSTVALQ